MNFITINTSKQREDSLCRPGEGLAEEISTVPNFQRPHLAQSIDLGRGPAGTMAESMRALPSIPRYGLPKAGHAIGVVPGSPSQLVRFQSSARSVDRKGIAQ
jgi:hypothetical protein